jgi:antitoxin ParD1/3/4
LPKNAIGATFTSKNFVMQTMNISLPDPMKQYVEEQVTVGDYSSASEYMRELVRANQKRNAGEQLEQTLQASLLEGEAQEATPEFWSMLRAEFDKRSKALCDRQAGDWGGWPGAPFRSFIRERVGDLEPQPAFFCSLIDPFGAQAPGGRTAGASRRRCPAP